MKNTLQLRGKVRVRQYRDGLLIFEHSGPNIVTSVGKNTITEILKENVLLRPSHMAIGTDPTPPAESQIALVAEITTPARSATGIGVVLTNEITYSASFTNTSAGPLIVEEAGLFNAATGPVMYARWLSSTVTMAVNDILAFDWTLTVG